MPVIKLLRCTTKYSMAIRQNTSSCCRHLPDLYVNHILTVLQTSIVVDSPTESISMMTHFDFNNFELVIVRTAPKFSMSCSSLPLVFIRKCVHLVHDKMPCYQNSSPRSLQFTGKIDAGTVRELDVASTSAPNPSIKQTNDIKRRRKTTPHEYRPKSPEGLGERVIHGEKYTWNNSES